MSALDTDLPVQPRNASGNPGQGAISSAPGVAPYEAVPLAHPERRYHRLRPLGAPYRPFYEVAYRLLLMVRHPVLVFLRDLAP